MGKYFSLQLKRLLRIVPFVLVSFLVLFIALIAVFNAVITADNSDDFTKFKLAFVADSEDNYFQSGLEVIQAYDSARFTIETFHMDEKSAIHALEKGRIDAYVVIPKGYIEDAINGHMGSLKYVSTAGAADLSTLFKDEITTVVSDIIVTSERAMYAIDDALEENGLSDRTGQFSYDISMSYIDYILGRTDLYKVEELGIQDSLGLSGYMFSGITVLLFTLLIIPFSPLYVKKELSVERLLMSKSMGAIRQTIIEFGSLYLMYLTSVFIVCVGVSLSVSKLPADVIRLVNVFSFKNFPRMALIAYVVSALGYFLFQLTEDLVSGVLVQFFVTLAMCFVSGCIYPLYFFPDSISRLAGFLPQAYAREVIASSITGDVTNNGLAALIVYGTALVSLSVFVRAIRIRKER